MLKNTEKRRQQRESVCVRGTEGGSVRGFSRCAGIMSLSGKVALVTGGAQGIGRAAVESLLQSSAKVSAASPTANSSVSCFHIL